MTLALNCLVLGEMQQDILTIKIDAAENVGTLKALIKEKNKHTFQHVDAKTLLLWKVSIPYDDINEYAGLPDDEALIPVKKLSIIFPNHEVGDNIDIIIKIRPSGKSDAGMEAGKNKIAKSRSPTKITQALTNRPVHLIAIATPQCDLTS